MRRSFKKVLLISTLFVAAAIATAGCQTNDSSLQAIQLWESYVNAVRDGDTIAARSCFTQESQEYFALYPELRADYQDFAYTITGTDTLANYTKLNILRVTSCHQARVTAYVTRSDSKPLLQLPFLVLAADWPVRSSEHFVVHSSLFAETDPSDTAVIVLTALEELYSRIHSLTGLQYPGQIHYYRCGNAEELAALRGYDGLTYTSNASCVITTDNYASYDIATILTHTAPENVVGLLRLVVEMYGLRDEGCFAPPLRYPDRMVTDRARIIERVGRRPLRYFLDGSPGDSLTRVQTDTNLIADGLIRFLIYGHDTDQFRALYENSATPEQFRKQLRSVYGFDLDSLEAMFVYKHGNHYPDGGER